MTITASLHEKGASHCFGLFIVYEAFSLFRKHKARVEINYRANYWSKYM